MLFCIYKVFGHSMVPQFKNGDILFISSIKYLFKNPSVNDIVVFKDKSGTQLIKRITKVLSNGYFVKGDNKLDSLDSSKIGLIKRSQIMGKVIFRI